MGHKGSQAGSDSDSSDRRVRLNNWTKKNSSSKIIPEYELQKNNGKSLGGGKVQNEYCRNQNGNRISSGGGGLEKDGSRNKNYNKTIPEEGELEKDDGEQNTVVVLKLGRNLQRYVTDIKEWIQSCGGVKSVDGDSNKLTVTGEVDEETLQELVGQMFSKKAQSNTLPPSKSRNNGDVEGVGKAEKATIKKLPKNPNHANSNESQSLVRTAVMMVDLHCQGCIDKICKVIENTKGYHDMSIDRQRNAVTVKGTMDMKALANRLSKKLSKRPVWIVPPDDHRRLQTDADSPSREKEMVGAASKTGKGTEPQKELDGSKSNKPPVTTTVLKVDVPCRCIGHFDRIRGIIANTKGFPSCEVSIDGMGKTVIKVAGSIDVNDLKDKLEKKLKKSVEITQPPPIFNDIDDCDSESENGREKSKTARDGGETHPQDAPTWHLDPHMYGDLKDILEKQLRKSVEITQPPPIFNDIDDCDSESENGREKSKTARDGGETHPQDAPTWHLDPHMYGDLKDILYGDYWSYYFLSDLVL